MKSLGEKTFTGSLWIVTSKWVIRFLGLISTIILARILTKEDFGIAAIAIMVVALLEVVLANGSVNYLIRKEKINPEDYNTAWTLRLILTTALGVILLITTKPLAAFFEEQQLIPVFYFLSLTIFLSGFQNIGMVIHKKNFNFKAIFIFDSLKKVFGFITSVGTAFYLENFWSIILGLFALRLSAIILSYYLSPFRPSLSLSDWKEQWDFSKWVFLTNLTNLSREKIEQIVISKMLGTYSMGVYSMAIQIASIPSRDLVEPLLVTLYSAYSSILKNKEKLANVFIKVIGVVSILILPMLAAFWLLSPQITVLLLGDKWDDVIPLLRIILFMIGAQIYMSMITNLLVALGKVKILAYINWLLIIILIPSMILSAYQNDLEFLIMVRTLLSLMFLPIFFFVLFRSIKISKKQMAFTFIRPLIATTIMTLSIYFFNKLIDFESDIIILFFDTIVGVIIYAIAIMMIWLVSGKAIGGEDYILDKIVKILQKFKQTKYFSGLLSAHIKTS